MTSSPAPAPEVGTRPWLDSPRRRDDYEPIGRDDSAGIAELLARLPRGEWISKHAARKLLKDAGIVRLSFSGELVESDSGMWFGVLDDTLPDLAPDGT